MRRCVEVLVIGATTLGCLLGVASAAEAWTTNGPLNFTATAPASRLTINNPSGPVSGNCTSTGASGNLKASQTSGTAIATITPVFTNCSIAGVVYTVSCSSVSLNAVSYSAGVTTGNLSGMSCTVVHGSCTITLTGSVNSATYTNPTSSTPGKASFATSAETITAKWNTGCQNSVFNGDSGTTGASAKYEAPAGGSTVTYTVTSPSAFSAQPRITNP